MYTGKLVRVSVLSRRNPDMPAEDYHKYWTEVHGPLITDWLERYGFVRYTQYHITTAQVRDGAGPGPLQGTLGNFDGIADFYVRSYEEFTEAFKDPFYLEKVKPDEEKFVDMSSIVVTVGYEEIILDTGNFEEKHKPQKV